uniref:Uncharacterized protein n=1 Tax=Anguilla anguilla TaxID=7936 RepID=A0A0E9SGS2_ANGAN
MYLDFTVSFSPTQPNQ